MIKNSVIIVLGLILISSCNKSDESCINAKTITISNVGQEFNYKGLKQVFSNSNFIISISKYASPNGDLVRDSFGVYIFRISDGAAFSTCPFLDIDNIDSNPNLGINPQGFFSSGSLKISNKCGEIFSTKDINKFYWVPTYNPKQEEGSYNVELKLTLDDNTDVIVNTTTEVINY